MSMNSPISDPLPRVLVVDDDPAIRDTLAEFLVRMGYQVTAAESGDEALAHLSQDPVDVVLTDILLPGINGLALTEEIRARHDCDVIVMTGYNGEFSYEDAIKKGASDFALKPVRLNELLLRIRRVLQERQLKAERDEMVAELQKLAITDNLTQLYNSRHFYHQLQNEIERACRYHHSLALMLMDIDFFKRYNDTYGHIRGDEALHAVGQTIKTCLRRMDSAYRYGGEEFTVLLPSTALGEALVVARRINQAVAGVTFVPAPETPVHLTISIGITQYCLGEELIRFVQRADQAMYVSKTSGRNRISTLVAD